MPSDPLKYSVDLSYGILTYDGKKHTVSISPSTAMSSHGKLVAGGAGDSKCYYT